MTGPTHHRRRWIMRTCEVCCREYRAAYSKSLLRRGTLQHFYSRTCTHCGTVNGRHGLTLAWERQSDADLAQRQAAGAAEAGWWDETDDDDLQAWQAQL